MDPGMHHTETQSSFVKSVMHFKGAKQRGLFRKSLVSRVWKWMEQASPEDAWTQRVGIGLMQGSVLHERNLGSRSLDWDRTNHRICCNILLATFAHFTLYSSLCLMLIQSMHLIIPLCLRKHIPKQPLRIQKLLKPHNFLSALIHRRNIHILRIVIFLLGLVLTDSLEIKRSFQSQRYCSCLDIYDCFEDLPFAFLENVAEGVESAYVLLLV